METNITEMNHPCYILSNYSDIFLDKDNFRSRPEYVHLL